MCQVCREKNNKITREYKQKLRKENKCVFCGVNSDTRLCQNCRRKNNKQYINSRYVQSKKAKQNYFGNFNDIIKII